MLQRVSINQIFHCGDPRSPLPGETCWELFPFSRSTFVVAMKACGDAGRWTEALALMDDMRRDGTPPMETTYTTAVGRVAPN